MPIPHRKPTRMTGYDYTLAGAYFVTFVTHNRECLLAALDAGYIILSPAGEIVNRTWLELPAHYPHIELGDMVIMPNHVHAIIIISVPPIGEGLRPSPTKRPSPTPRPSPAHGLPEIVRAWKTFSARQINTQRGTPGALVWQRSFHDRIIRDDIEWQKIASYIQENPTRWADDDNYPTNL